MELFVENNKSKNTANFPFAEKATLGLTLLGEDGVTIISSFFIHKTFLVFKYSYINKSGNKKPREIVAVCFYKISQVFLSFTTSVDNRISLWRNNALYFLFFYNITKNIKLLKKKRAAENYPC